MHIDFIKGLRTQILFFVVGAFISSIWSMHGHLWKAVNSSGSGHINRISELMSTKGSEMWFTMQMMVPLI
jgi:hypothetical protein